MNIINRIPLPLSGLVLALLSLGNLLFDYHPYFKYIFGAVGAIFLIGIVLKIFFYTDNVRNDLKNPVILSSFGTFSMSLMLLSTYIQAFLPPIAYTMWIIGVALHISLIVYFTYRFIIRDFNILNVYPSYWIVYIGITMSAITAHFYGLTEFGFICFLVGFVLMTITLPLITYRYIKHPEVADMNKPLICIYTALFSILIVGYVNSTPSLSITFLQAMFFIACLFYLFAFKKLVEYRNLEFYPSFSAFTFPFVISALASKETANILNNVIINNITSLETVIATILVVYVLIRYLKFMNQLKITD